MIPLNFDAISKQSNWLSVDHTFLVKFGRKILHSLAPI